MGFVFLVRGFWKRLVYALPRTNASVVGDELYVNNLLVVGAINGDGGGEFDFDWGVHGCYHGVCVRISHGDDEVGKSCVCVLTKMG